MDLAKLKNYNTENNTRYCKKCDKHLDLSMFSTRIMKTHKNLQYREICKICSVNSVKKSKYSTEVYRKQMRVSDSRKSMVIAARKRAKEKGIPCTISYSDLVIPERCPLLDIPIFVCTKELTGRFGACDNSPTIDRIDNFKGYIASNVWVISHRANTLKGNTSIFEL